MAVIEKKVISKEIYTMEIDKDEFYLIYCLLGRLNGDSPLVVNTAGNLRHSLSTVLEAGDYGAAYAMAVRLTGVINVKDDS